MSVLQRISNGDKTAVQDCLKKYGGLIWSLAKKLLPNPEDAEDAVQEIFIDLWKNAARFDESQSSETTFVAMVARRRLIDRIRKANRQINADSIESVLVEPANNSDKTLQMSVEAQQAAKALQNLRLEQRQVLQLSIYQGLSQKEIADVLKMPIGTVKTHARRGIIEVREYLGLNERSNDKEVKL
jgi:RNA polymerase sigma-70 factor (ECF subfamily)